ncbi:MAG: DUF4296 domain-containing protein [Chitinophagaceae bacterium]|nr:DUF4296 domain-containing protein [Chitinophagaceae bacterium]
MRIVAGLLCILLIAGCSEKDKIPSGVIDKEEMEKILWDMMLADQYAANYIIKDSSKVNVKMETLKLYEEVFRLHKITRDEFRKSFQFYQGRPDITRVMFDSLVARGNRARMENYTRPPQPPPVVPQVKAADSTLKAKAAATKSGAKPVVGPPAGAKRGGLPDRGNLFLRRGSGHPLKAGEMPFRPVRKDSVSRGHQ